MCTSVKLNDLVIVEKLIFLTEKTPVVQELLWIHVDLEPGQNLGLNRKHCTAKTNEQQADEDVQFPVQ